MGLARILIADPDPRALALTVTGLRNAGFDVLSTTRGEEALALLQSQPAAVFCEIGVEGIDGFTLCETARKAPATRELPFFLMSRKDERGLRDRARAAGATDYLTKPLYLRDVCTLAKLFAGLGPDGKAIEGDLGATPLFYVLRALTSGGLSGTVEIPGESGVVHFREGRVVEAAAAALKGEAAVGRLLVLAKGPFTLRLGPVLLRGSMAYSLRDLITHDEPRRRRFERAVEIMGGHEARLTIHFPTLAHELPRLPPSIERIVRLFDGERALGDVLRAADLDEVTAAETILRLFTLRIIRPATELLAAPPSDVPRLFEPRPDEVLLAMHDLFPDAAPILLTELPESTPGEVRDWFTEVGQGGLEDILAAGTGGWLELPANEAGQRLRESVGELSETEIERQLGAFDALDGKASTDAADGAPGEASAAEEVTAAASSPSGAADSIDAAIAGSAEQAIDEGPAAVALERPAATTAAAEPTRETAPAEVMPTADASAEGDAPQGPAPSAESAPDPAETASEDQAPPAPNEQVKCDATAVAKGSNAESLAAFLVSQLTASREPESETRLKDSEEPAQHPATGGKELATSCEATAASATTEEQIAGDASADERQAPVPADRDASSSSVESPMATSGPRPSVAPAADEDAFFSSEPGFDDEALPPQPPSVLRPVLIVGGIALVVAMGIVLLKPSHKASDPIADPIAQQETPPVAPEPARAPKASKPAPDTAPAADTAALQPARRGEEQPETKGDALANPPAAQTDPTPDSSKPASHEAGDHPEAAAADDASQEVKAAPPAADVIELLAKGRKLYDQGRPEAALKPLEKAASLAPDNCDVYVLLALARLDVGQLGPAEKAALRALEIDASNARAHLVLGTVHQERGDAKSAKAEYQTYLKLAPSGDYAKDVRAILAGMR